MVAESKPFLKIVADDLKCHDDVEDSLLVFPNRRAILFFNECWIDDCGKPVFGLESTTIQDLFHSLSPYTIADELVLLIELFYTIKDVCPDILGADVSFDKFYFWGQTLLSDFDDIDKNCVNAQALFSNVADLQSMKDISYLSEAQIETLKHFFQTFSVDAQNEKIQLFAKLWKNLYTIYISYKERLHSKSIAYEGMLMLDVIEKLKSGEIDDSKYRKLVFIGFNVLSRTEYAFFKRYRDSKRADFYWDYDIYYSAPDSLQEAGLFMRQNILDFPSSLKDQSLFDNYSKKKKITFVSTSSDSAQAAYVSKFLNDTSDLVIDEKTGEKESIDRRTAIVLCDETLLLPVIHSIPTDKDLALNVTMGFPVSQTPIASMILAFSTYHTLIDDRKPKTVSLNLIEPIANHAYIKTVFPEVTNKVALMKEKKNLFPRIVEFDDDEELSLLFKSADNTADFIERLKQIVIKIATSNSHYSLFSDLYNESLFRVYNLLVRFGDEVCSRDLSMSVGLTAQLLNKVIQQTSVPFHGEPIEGLQVMGFLETRGLDFSHICLLSASNNQLPPVADVTSFIPLSIRTGFNMTSIEQKNALFAYYFYRLVQRAEDITLVYNSSCDCQSTDGQMSRYMLQMLIEKNENFEINKFDIQNMVPSISAESWSEKKSDEIVQLMLKRFSNPDKPLSPSAINLYFECPMKFYFKYGLGLKEPNVDDEGISPTDLGTIFHAVMEEIYAQLIKRKGSVEISKSDLKSLQDDEILVLIDHFINIHYYKVDQFGTMPRKVSQFHGHLLVARNLLLEFVRKQLAVDCKLNDFVYVASEEKVVIPIEIDVNGEKKSIFVGGIVDRQDSVDGGRRRIVDYKTGGTPPSAINNIDDLFGYEKRKKVHYPLQILIYSSLVHKLKQVDVVSVLNFVNQIEDKVECTLSISKEVADDKGETKNIKEEILVNEEFCDEFDEKLKNALSDIFNVNIDFHQTKEPEEFCEFCSFSQICRKRKEQ